MTELASNVRSVLLAAPEVRPPQKFRRESIIFHQRQNSTGVFLVESGLVKTTRTSDDGSKLILSVVGSHQLVGEECLQKPLHPYLADCTCLTDVTGYHIPIVVLRRLLSVHDVGEALVSYVTARHSELVQKIEMLALHDVEHRVLHGLAMLATLVKESSNGAGYLIPMTQAEIASFVGATRETTSTTLSALRQRQLVSLSRRLVKTVHPDMLIRAANARMTQARTAS